MTWEKPTSPGFLGVGDVAEQRQPLCDVHIGDTRQDDHRPDRVVQTVIQIGGKVALGDPKTARGRRSVKLDTSTVATLRARTG